MQEKINQILDLILQSLQSVGHVVSKEAPILLHQLVTYYVIESLPFISFGLFIVLFYMWRIALKSKYTSEDEKSWIIGILLLVHVVSFSCFISGMKSSMEGYFAPEAFLVMQIKSTVVDKK